MKYVKKILIFVILFSTCKFLLVGANIVVLGDYYTWYEKDKWINLNFSNGDILYPFTDPERGHYDSSDPLVAAEQNEEKNNFSLTEKNYADVISWWGPGTFSETKALAGYFNAYNFSERKFCILYESMELLIDESEGNGVFDFDNPENEQRFLMHIDYLLETFFSYPNCYKIDGRPVVYIWAGQFKNFKQTSDKVRKKVYLVGPEPILFPPSDNEKERVERLSYWDAITSYGIDPVYLAGKYGFLTIEAIEEYVKAVVRWDRILKLYAPNTKLILSVQFAYHDGRGDIDENGNNRILTSTPEQAENFIKTARFLADKLGIDKIHLTSYNEHWEGHGAEPSKEYGDLWFRLIKKYFIDKTTEPVEVDYRIWDTFRKEKEIIKWRRE